MERSIASVGHDIAILRPTTVLTHNLSSVVRDAEIYYILGNRGEYSINHLPHEVILLNESIATGRLSRAMNTRTHTSSILTCVLLIFFVNFFV